MAPKANCVPRLTVDGLESAQFIERLRRRFNERNFAFFGFYQQKIADAENLAMAVMPLLPAAFARV